MFRLKVQQVDQSCLLDLTWGQGQSLSAQLPYPTVVTQAYEKWLLAYLHFYRNLSPSPPVAAPQRELRGHVIKKGGTDTAGGRLASGVSPSGIPTALSVPSVAAPG